MSQDDGVIVTIAEVVQRIYFIHNPHQVRQHKRELILSRGCSPLWR